tara:strand:- start:35 stop:907 length:873 start_codon:yes stop_codon:yes gene_type:complete
MKVFAYHVIKVHADQAEDAFELLQAYVRRRDVNGSIVLFFLRVPEQQWPEIRPICEHICGRSLAHVRIDAEFTKSEIESAELLVVQINRAPVIRNLEWAYQWSGDNVNNPLRFPWSLQVNDLVVDSWRSRWANAGLMSSQFGECIVTANATDLFRAVPGMLFRDLRKKNGEILAGAWQLYGITTPQPFTNETKGLVDILLGIKQFQTRVVCEAYSEPFCPVMPAIVGDDVNGGKLPAAFFSAELFGEPDWEPGYQRLNAPQPALIVTQQFRRALMGIGIKRLRYIPIRLA